MEEAVMLSATLRRSSPVTQRRVLAVLFALSRYTKKNGMNFSLASVVSLLWFVLAGKSVRFLFAAGGNSSVLRSHDRGGSWRLMWRVGAPARGDAEELRQPQDDTVRMEEIAQLLRPIDPAADKPEGGGLTALAAECETHLTQITTLGSMVAVGGGNLFIAVSGDMGMVFTTLEKNLIFSSFNSNAVSSDNSWQVSGVAFLSDVELFFSCENCLFLVKYALYNLDSVLFEHVDVVYKFSDYIACIKTFACPGKRFRELYVSTKDVLHYSCDGGRSFIGFPHLLGVIRALEPLDATLRRCEVPQPPKTFLDFLFLQADNGSKPDRGLEKYAYQAASRHVFVGDGEVDSEHRVTVGFFDLPTACGLPFLFENIYFRVLFVAGVGSRILPYDYTAILFVSAVPGDQTGQFCTVGSVAKNVEYIPYIKSGALEPISIAVCRRPFTRECVLARGNAAGVSVSTNSGASWETPTQAFTVALLAIDGGEFVCCNRRNVINIISGSRNEVYIVPTVLRVPYLTAAAVML